jgi:hypothetical protein
MTVKPSFHIPRLLLPKGIHQVKSQWLEVAVVYLLFHQYVVEADDLVHLEQVVMTKMKLKMSKVTGELENFDVCPSRKKSTD